MENGAGFVSEPRTRHDPGWPNSLLGGLICVAVMFLPSFWCSLGRRRSATRCVIGRACNRPCDCRSVAGTAVSGIPNVEWLLNG
jgi:hypothetical protein